jgi:cell wall assembly regulator SMI1
LKRNRDAIYLWLTTVKKEHTRVASFVVYLVTALGMVVMVLAAYKAFAKSPPIERPPLPQLHQASNQNEITLADALETWLQRFDERKIEMRKQLNPPASAEQISRLEKKTGIKLPEDLLALYQIANGQQDPFKVTYRTGQPNIIELPFAVAPDAFVGNLFGSYEFLSTIEAEKEWENWRLIYSGSSQAERDDFDDNIQVRQGDPVRKHYTNLRWLPFARDGDGNSYAVDMDPAEGGRAGQVIVIGPDEDLRRVLAPSLKEFFAASAKRGFGNNINAEDQRFYFDMED